jgi:hypothetical protein
MNAQSPIRTTACGLLLAAALAVPLRPGAAPAGRWLGAAPLAAQLPAPAVSSSRSFHLAGYASVVVGRSDYAGEPVRNDLTEAAAALLVSGSFGRASYFGEIEPASRRRENWSGREQDRISSLERLYLEYAFGDALRLRAGRFLTPVGQWNELHAEPLTWTALRPLATYRPFAKSTNGFMVAGTVPLGERDAGYAVYLAPFNLRDFDGQETGFTSAGGGRLAIEVLPQLYVGASVVRFRASRPRTPGEDGTGGGAAGGEVENGETDPSGREEDSGARNLFGGDASWSHRGVELLAEGVVLSRSSTLPAEGGAFLQAAVPVLPVTHLVLRLERYGPVGSPDLVLNIYTVGATVRPDRHLALKLERQLTSRLSTRVADGWFLSASAIF